MIFDVSTKNIHFYRVLGLRENCLLSLQAALNERDLMSNKVKELIAENKTIKETQKNVQVLNIQLFFTQILPSLLLKKKRKMLKMDKLQRAVLRNHFKLFFEIKA